MGNHPSAGEVESGLLEQPALILSPATRAGRRGILGPDGREVGFAEWRWLGWWGGYALAVHEPGDAPLVFTLRRRWALPTRREVRDAEGDFVGEVAGRSILDRWGEGVMRSQGRDEAGRWLDLGGVVLSEWLRQGGCLRLEFRPEVRGDPFACMLLLAAALVLA